MNPFRGTDFSEDGKALTYFVADGHLTSVFGVDEKWVGAVKGGRYSLVPIEPGEHHLCAMLQFVLPLGGPRVSVHSLRAEPSGIYYFRTRMVGDQYRVRSSTRPVGFGRGKVVVAWSKFSTSHRKH